MFYNPLTCFSVKSEIIEEDSLVFDRVKASFS